MPKYPPLQVREFLTYLMLRLNTIVDKTETIHTPTRTNVMFLYQCISKPVHTDSSSIFSSESSHFMMVLQFWEPD